MELNMKSKQIIDPQLNSVVCGDCKGWLNNVPLESVDMCYIDPPFFSNTDYEITWGNCYEKRSFNDRWKGGKSGIDVYIRWMRKRVKLIHNCLKQTGTIFLHCDWRTSHRLRGVLDDIFGENNFINEIVWCYSSPSNCTKSFPKKHDTILFYSKSDKYCFNTDKVRVPQKRQYPSAGKGMASGNRSVEEIRQLELKSLKRGKIVEDYWTDIPSGSHISKNERVGYRTQKPERLLERIISCSTNEGDVVLDCFVGGGTTAVVAAELNRRFIVGDVSPVAVRVTCERLFNKTINSPEIINVPRTIDEWLEMDGHAFAEEICKFMGWECNPKKSGDGGIDGWAKNRSIAIQIKNSEKVGERSIREFFGSITKYSEGFFVAHSFTKKAENYRARIEADEDKSIRFICVEKILESILIDQKKRDELDKIYREKTAMLNLSTPSVKVLAKA